MSATCLRPATVAIVAAVLGQTVLLIVSRPAAAQDPSTESSFVANGEARISARVIDLLLQRDVQQTKRVNQQLLGAQTTGRLVFQGGLRVGLVPDNTAASIELRLDGQANIADSVAQRGRVTIHSACYSNVSSTKRLVLDHRGVHVYPANTRCSTDIDLRCVCAPPLIRRLALMRAQQMLPQAVAATSRNIARQVGRSVDAEADGPFIQFNDRYLKEVRQPLLESGGFPEVVRVTSSSSHIRIQVQDSVSDTIPTPERLTEFNTLHDVAVSVHETLVANLGQSLLSGMVVTDRQVLNLVRSLRGSAPVELWVHDRSIPWSFTLADQQPITARFADGDLTLTFRLNEAERNHQRLGVPLQIQATYKPQITRDGPAFLRQGPVRMITREPVVDSRTRDIASFLNRKFDAFLAQEIYFEGLTPPDGGTWGKLRQLRLALLSSDQGWFQLSYQLEPSVSMVASTEAR